MRTLYTLTDTIMDKSNNVCLPDGDPIILCENFDTKIQIIVNNMNCTLTNNCYLIEEDINTNIRSYDFKTPLYSANVDFIKAMRKSAPHDGLPLRLSNSISNSIVGYYYNIIKTSFDNGCIDGIIKYAYLL